MTAQHWFFEFDDKAWVKVNLHANLPPAARHALENAIWLYRIRPRPRNSDIKDELANLAAKADALHMTSSNLSDWAYHTLGNSIEVGEDSKRMGFSCMKWALPLRDLAAKTALGMANQHPGSDSRSREWLVAAAAKIYEVHAKKSFKYFKNRNRFIGNLLEAAGVNVGKEEAIRKMIRKYNNGKLLPAQELEDICLRLDN
jgi:hypothetical protein